MTGYELTATALRIHAAELGAAKGLLVLLCSFWSEGGQVFPGGKLLMARAGISETSLTTYIKTLERAGLVKVIRRPNKSSLYHLNVAAIEKAANDSGEVEAGWADDTGNGAPNSGEPDPQILGVVTPNSGGVVNQSTNQKNKPEVNIMAQPKIELDFSPLDMTPELVDEVKAIRKSHTKGKPLTQRIINTLGKEFAECRTAGATDDQILNEWSVRGWQGFKADWFLRDFKRPGQNIAQATSRRPTKYQQQMADQDVMFSRFLGTDQHQGNTYEHA
ncbi:hypothetical protein D3C79_398300 [compost metagenome]